MTNCQVCIQCANYDQAGSYQWVEGPEQCVQFNAGPSIPSQAVGTGDENTGGIRCRVRAFCS